MMRASSRHCYLMHSRIKQWELWIRLFVCSHKQKRSKQLKRMRERGQLDPDKLDAFSRLLDVGRVTHCLYKDSERILGNTFGMCILQVLCFLDTHSRSLYDFVKYFFVTNSGFWSFDSKSTSKNNRDCGGWWHDCFNLTITCIAY